MSALTTITLYHDTKASRKADRCWKVVVPIPNGSEAIPLQVDTPDGLILDSEYGQAAFEQALAIASSLVADALGIEPEWTHGSDWLGNPTARFDISEVAA